MELKSKATVERMAREAARLRQVAHDMGTSADLRDKHIADLRSELERQIADAQRERAAQMAAADEAEDLQAIVADLCRDNRWELPRVEASPAPERTPSVEEARRTPVCLCMIGQPPRLDCPVHGDRPPRDEGPPPGGGSGSRLAADLPDVEEALRRVRGGTPPEGVPEVGEQPDGEARAVAVGAATSLRLVVGVWLAVRRPRHAGSWRVLPHRKGSLVRLPSRPVRGVTV